MVYIFLLQSMFNLLKEIIKILICFDKQLSYKWLHNGYLFAETENYKKYIIKENIDNGSYRNNVISSLEQLST